MSSSALVKTIFIIAIGLQVFISESNSFANAEELNFSPVKYRNCKSRFEILSVEATDCGGNEERCIFRRNTEETIRIGFKPDRTVNDLKTMVFANLGDASGALTKFHLENDQTCQGNNITCPLEAGKTYYYSQSVHILPEYPTIDVQVNWLLTDTSTNNKDSESSNVPTDRDVCIKFLATVKE
ncbi:ML domain-containing protein [Ditylenchus destructor]|uniref:ML domain-containing protein n=1 Tax=Ditylenchus destructor TaxID=166010 RepID=A0AAD4NGL0_9BILA|nr:ML domain-containing protein [Ditylenchus destructor]